MLTLEDILLIFRSIVIAFPWHNKRRLNTYALVDNIRDLNAENLQKNYEQFDAGYFWAREWVDSGASRDTLKTDYDLLFLECKQMTILDLFRNPKPVSYKIFITIASPVKCNDGTERSWEQVDRDNREMMVMVLTELYTVKLYEITIEAVGEGEGETYHQWMTPGEAAAYDALERYTVIDTCKELRNFIIDPNIQPNIFTSNFGVDNLRTQTVELNFKGCLLPTESFNYIVWPPIQV